MWFYDCEYNDPFLRAAGRHLSPNQYRVNNEQRHLTGNHKKDGACISLIHF